MKIAFCNEVFGNWPLEKQFESVASAGYDGIELAPFTLDEAFASGAEASADVKRISAARRQLIRRLAEQNNLEVSGLHWLLAKTTGLHLTSADADQRNRTAEYFKDLIRFGAETGAHYLVLGSPVQRNLAEGVSLEEGYDRAASVLEQLLPLLEESQMILGLEPLAPVETNFLNTARQALDLITKMGNPGPITIHLDCKAMADGEDRPIPEVIADPAIVPFEKTFHAQDPNMKGPGFGNLDFGPILAALKATGFSGWIGIEPFDYSDGADVLCKNSIDYLKSVG
ncbi:MAG: sugar phosphate isomerase/epimerase [Thermoguttaceae bacterium]|nr:sugar phosphate isomerase/epimerase [Thermoguttaceae bacterium]